MGSSQNNQSLCVHWNEGTYHRLSDVFIIVFRNNGALRYRGITSIRLLKLVGDSRLGLLMGQSDFMAVDY